MSKDKRTYRTLSEEEIKAYLEGKITGKAAHELERHLLTDEFDREAVEGFERLQGEELSRDIHILKTRLANRSTGKFSGWLKMAATLALLLVSVAVAWYYLDRSGGGDASLALKGAPESSTENFAVPADTVPGVEPQQPGSAERETSPIADKQASGTERNPPERTKPVVSPSEEVKSVALPEQVEAGSEFSQDMALSEEAETQNEKAKEEQFNIDLQGIAQEDAAEKEDSAQPLRAEESMVLKKSLAGSGIAVLSRSGPADKLTVSGKVTDEAGEPIPGVTVTVMGTATGAATDLDGSYQLSIPDDKAMLLFAFIGMRSAVMPVDGKAEINVEMEPDVTSLSEVVITGYGEVREEEPGYTGARPSTGNADYKDYLEQHLQYPPAAREKGIEGKVVLKVTISPAGNISDIEVKRSLGYGCDEEAIRLVKSGPGWEPAMRNGLAVESTVRVRVEFEL